MDESTVTITLNKYNQLRDSAVMNNLLLDKITRYESQIMDIHQKWVDMNDKIFALENKIKS